jgi:phosphoserine phosphatase RsbU/P
MDGIDVLKKIKENNNQVEIIMITGHGDVETAIQALNLGAFGYIQKPIEYDELVIEIKKALEKQRMQKKIDTYIKSLEVVINEKSEELKLRKEAEDALQQNIEQAKEYQTKLIRLRVPRVHNMRFYSFYRPCDKVGGDIFNILQVNNQIIFYIADIVGHGVAAAILSTFIKANIDHWIINDAIISPRKILMLLKESLQYQEIFNENMLTIFIGTLDIKLLSLVYSNAGHFPPLVLINEKIIELNKSSYPVSDIIKNVEYIEEHLQLTNNSKIFIYTDGLIEVMDENREVYGTKGLKNYIEKNGFENQSFLNFIQENINNSITDDVTYVFFLINSSSEKKYYCDLNDYDIIIKEFEDEMLNRYENDCFCHKVINCFYELITNSIEHGNCNDKKKGVFIRVNYEIDKVAFMIKDEGAGFELKNNNGDEILNSQKLRGRGLYLVRQFAQKVEYIFERKEIYCEFKI